MKKAHNRPLSVMSETIKHLTVELPRDALRRARGGSADVDITGSTTQISHPTDSSPTTHTFVPEQPF